MSCVIDIHKIKGIRPDFDVYIGRVVRYHKEFTKDSKWRNRSKTLEEYEQWVRKNLWNDLNELIGKKLGCWCDVQNGVLCHGLILLKLIKEKFD